MGHPLADSISIRQVTAPPLAELGPLIAESEAAGLRGLSRLVDELDSNRYDRPGEAFFTAWIDGQLAGLCGLNVCPYAGDPAVGRVRRLYVAERFRRRGVGRALLAAVIDAAEGHFRELTVRAGNAEAGPFYLAMGLVPVTSEIATHRLELR